MTSVPTQRTLLSYLGIEEGPPIKIPCLIYKYENTNRYSEHFGKKYVGQTMQDFHKRHSGHLNGSLHFNEFLRQEPLSYETSIIEQQVFQRVCITEQQTEDLEDVAHDWMDERVTYWIAAEQSYEKGFNMSKGRNLDKKNRNRQSKRQKKREEFLLFLKGLEAYASEFGVTHIHYKFEFPENNLV